VQSVEAVPAGQLRQPQLTLWFELPPEVAAQRLAGARAPDRFESQPVEFFRKVAQGYARRADGDPARFARIDGSRPREQVWAQVIDAVKQRGWLA